MILASIFFLAQSLEETKSENLEKKDIDITTNISIEELQSLIEPNGKNETFEMEGKVKIVTIDENGNQIVQEYDLNNFPGSNAPLEPKEEIERNDMLQLMQAQINGLKQMLRNPHQNRSRNGAEFGDPFFRFDTGRMRSRGQDMFDIMMQNQMYENRERDMFDIMMQNQMHENGHQDSSETFTREMFQAIDSVHERLDHQEGMLKERMDNLENMFNAIDSVHERLNNLESMLRKIEKDVDNIIEHVENLD